MPKDNEIKEMLLAVAAGAVAGAIAGIITIIIDKKGEKK